MRVNRLKEMTDSGVHQIVDSAFKDYEREIAKPRHVENSEKLTEYNAKLNDVLSTMDKVDGGVTAIKHILRWLGGSLAGAWAIVKLVQTARGH